jgi:HD-GYP domain-containing protein (c-di-GMP phosphodiesterase class II)
MANIVIWGRARDILTGELPTSASVAEVSSLDELRRELSETSAALVLADSARLESERADLGALADGFDQAVVVAVVEHGEAEETLQRYPFLDEVLLRPVTASRLRLRLERALEAVHNRRVIRHLEREVDRKGEDLRTLNRIGVALSAERDNDKLLELILLKSREITLADAGSLYLVERGKDDDTQTDDRLHFTLTQNDSVNVPFVKSVVPLNETSIAGYAAKNSTVVNVPDAYNLPPGSSYKISRSFDEKSGYRTKSMLVVPMRDHRGKVIGVVQLINKKKSKDMVLRPVALVEEAVIPFTSVDEELVSSLASQAAVAYENAQLIQNIQNLFEKFVHASVKTIEARDPVTSGHSGRVATLTVALAEKVDGLTTGPFKDASFTKDQVREIEYASLLHDFGKVGVPEVVLNKARKLFDPELLLIKERFAYIRKSIEAEYLRAKLEQVLSGRANDELLRQMDAAQAERQAEIDDLLKKVVKSNEPTILEEDCVRTLLDLPLRKYEDIEGQPLPFLTPVEVEFLSIRKGSLSEEERHRINEHVSHTYEFLKELPWTPELRRVPEIAWAHHEKLDGTGYPRKLVGRERIPVQSRMMTISDIYDALTDIDRPYKKSLPLEKALDILVDEARHGKIDQDLLDVFIEAKIYEKPKKESKAGAQEEVRRR